MATKLRKAKAKPSRLARELLETAQDMRASGLLTKAAHEKITMRHKADIPAATVPMSGQTIKALREEANLRDRKSTRLNSSHALTSRMPSSA